MWHEHEEEKRNNIYRTYFLPSRNVKLQKVSKYGLFWVCHMALENWDQYRWPKAPRSSSARPTAAPRPGAYCYSPGDWPRCGIPPTRPPPPCGKRNPPGATQLRHKLGLMIVKLERTHDFGSFLSFLVVDQGEKVWTTQV